MYLGTPATDKFYDEVEKRQEAERQHKDADKCQEAEPIIKRTKKLSAQTHTILKLGRIRIYLHVEKTHFRYFMSIQVVWKTLKWVAWQRKLRKMKERGVLR